MTKVEKMYNGEPTEKCRFIVIDPNSGSDAEKIFDVGKRSARLMVPKLKEGHRSVKNGKGRFRKGNPLYSNRSSS